MYSEISIRDVNLESRKDRDAVVSFLNDCGLRLDPLEFYAGAYDPDGNIVAGAGLDGCVIKCVAVREEARGGGIVNKLLSRVLEVASEQDRNHLFVYTKPENADIFRTLGFHQISSHPSAILMENNPFGIEGYCSYLRGNADDPALRKGVIVMNANPFTLGHRYLVEKASARVDRLYIIPVSEDKSLFTTSERTDMIKRGVENIPNVTVLKGSRYAVSAATFPSYFLKKEDEATEISMSLDLDIFCRYIAPSLGVSVRFAGTEPSDPLTALYNSKMREMLPEAGLEFIEVERCCVQENNIPVRATSVRRFMDEGNIRGLCGLVPVSTIPYVLAHLASRALIMELELTPKPGLVDCENNGAHTDMNVYLMRKSINTLRPWFVELATEGILSSGKNIERIISIGIGAEKAMYEATGGVNTHKGAIFALGLMVYCASYLSAEKGYIASDDLRDAIREVALQIPYTENTNGADVRNRYGISGAMDEARKGYGRLFDVWLPYLRGNKSGNNLLHLLLLKIISGLDDSNVYHRGGRDEAEKLKQNASVLLSDFSLEGLRALDKTLISKNISPGGSADMLSLTILADILTD